MRGEENSERSGEGVSKGFGGKFSAGIGGGFFVGVIEGVDLLAHAGLHRLETLDKFREFRIGLVEDIVAGSGGRAAKDPEHIDRPTSRDQKKQEGEKFFHTADTPNVSVSLTRSFSPRSIKNPSILGMSGEVTSRNRTRLS